MKEVQPVRGLLGSLMGGKDEMFRKTGAPVTLPPLKAPVSSSVRSPAERQADVQPSLGVPPMLRKNMPFTASQMESEDMTIKESDQIRSDEGFRDKVYLDSRGFPTVGTGHLLTAEEKKKYKVGDKFDEDVLEEYYQKDLQSAVDSANKLAPEWASTELKDILTNMSFQMGEQGVRNFKKMHKALSEGDYKEAAVQMKDSAWYEQTPNRAKRLIKRMEELH